MRWCSHLLGPLPISFIFNAIIRDCVRWCLTIAETVALTLSIDFAKSNIWWDSQIYSLVCSRSCHPEIVDPDSDFKKNTQRRHTNHSSPVGFNPLTIESSRRRRRLLPKKDKTAEVTLFDCSFFIKMESSSFIVWHYHVLSLLYVIMHIFGHTHTHKLPLIMHCVGGLWFVMMTALINWSDNPHSGILLPFRAPIYKTERDICG